MYLVTSFDSSVYFYLLLRIQTATKQEIKYVCEKWVLEGGGLQIGTLFCCTSTNHLNQIEVLKMYKTQCYLANETKNTYNNLTKTLLLVCLSISGKISETKMITTVSVQNNYTVVRVVKYGNIVAISPSSTREMNVYNSCR